MVSQTNPLKIKPFLPFNFTITIIYVAIRLVEDGTRMSGLQFQLSPSISEDLTCSPVNLVSTDSSQTFQYLLSQNIFRFSTSLVVKGPLRFLLLQLPMSIQTQAVTLKTFHK